MTTHFLFQEGVWEGSGEITIPLADGPLPLHVRWTISALDDDRFQAVQYVTVDGHEPMSNTFTVGKVAGGEFQLFLENENIGMFSGEGISDEHKIAWEFSHKGGLEGFEVYERKEKGSYIFKAKYLCGDGLSTVISGDLIMTESKR